MKKYIHAIIWLKRYLLNRTDHTIKIFKILDKKIKIDTSKPIILIDIGSHAGSWTFAFCKNYKKSKSICFEASKYYFQVFEILKKFFINYDIDSFNYAVSDSIKYVHLNFKDKKKNKLLTGQNFISFDSNKNFLSHSIQSISLDYFFKNKDMYNLKFIKIDIEGCELLALKGSKGIINKYKPIVIFEFFEPYAKRFNYEFEEIRKFFEELGYQIYSIINFKLIKTTNTHFYTQRNFYAIFS